MTAQAFARHPGPLPTSGERGRRGLALAAVLLALLSALAGAALAQTFPTLTGRIVDNAALLSAEDRRALEADLKALEDKSTDQLVIYTTRSLQGYVIEDYAYKLGRAWAIGQKDKNNGVILLVAPNERKVRIEVGRGLEPIMTDIMSKLIVENAILPAFRRGDFVAGIKAGVRDIRDVLLGDAEAVRQRAKLAAKRPGMDNRTIALVLLGLFIVIALSVVWIQQVQTAHPGRAVGRDRRRRRDEDWGSSSSGWSGGSGGSSDSGGGGFSGGGGDFGGGGASGSW
jgi:uncharacterized protein